MAGNLATSTSTSVEDISVIWRWQEQQNGTMNVPNRGIDILRWLSFLFDIIGSDLFSITEDIHLHANAFQVQVFVVVFWFKNS